MSFGNSCHINCYKVEKIKYIYDEYHIEELIKEIVKFIDMKIEGEIITKYYMGRDEDTEGWSAICFLDSSSLSFHSTTVNKNIYLDVFSCKTINLKRLVEFLNDKLDCEKITHTFLKRK